MAYVEAFADAIANKLWLCKKYLRFYTGQSRVSLSIHTSKAVEGTECYAKVSICSVTYENDYHSRLLGTPTALHTEMYQGLSNSSLLSTITTPLRNTYVHKAVILLCRKEKQFGVTLSALLVGN